MNRVTGLAIGAGTSAMYVGLGFKPTRLRLQNIDQAENEQLDWNINMQRSAACVEGVIRKVVAGDVTVLTKGIGVMTYAGGDLITTASANYVVHKTHPALNVGGATVKYGGDMRNMPAGGGLISTWTLGSAANRTGNFNVECDTTYVGIGSPVFIKPTSGVGPVRCAYIVALTSNGEQANEVTLSEPVPSGNITFIGYKYDFVNLPAGYVMPAGFVINEYANINVASQLFLIDAEE